MAIHPVPELVDGQETPTGPGPMASPGLAWKLSKYCQRGNPYPSYSVLRDTKCYPHFKKKYDVASLFDLTGKRQAKFIQGIFKLSCYL